MRAEQTVSETAVEALARQADAPAEGTGEPFDDAFARTEDSRRSPPRRAGRRAPPSPIVSDHRMIGEGEQQAVIGAFLVAHEGHTREVEVRLGAWSIYCRCRRCGDIHTYEVDNEARVRALDEAMEQARLALNEAMEQARLALR